MVYLEYKLQEGRYGGHIFKIERDKSLETTYFEAEKKTKKVLLLFLAVKTFSER